ncbi:hypothetical protein D9756_008155 [Leucocoprinus leucothites]|uniref:Uncharacterized protein n=1 Tax=Leucocoprinus leucothites TaxID=201217 RepID=A0A8H5FW20_9AGAR|nr:hypothetical protein D9756_008155 [Leucoagaricus leucothites]
MAAVVLMPPPQQILQLPRGVCGISYDLSTSAIRRNHPDELGASPGTMSTRVSRSLNAMDLDRVQHSVYQSSDTTAGNMWSAMYALRLIEPRGVFPTVVTAIQMYHMDLPDMFIATDSIRLRAVADPHAISPIPRNLFPPNRVPVPLAQPDLPLHPLPKGTRDNASSRNKQNWGL